MNREYVKHRRLDSANGSSPEARAKHRTETTLRKRDGDATGALDTCDGRSERNRAYGKHDVRKRIAARKQRLFLLNEANSVD